jgi:hypothetical protein
MGGLSSRMSVDDDTEDSQSQKCDGQGVASGISSGARGDASAAGAGAVAGIHSGGVVDTSGADGSSLRAGAGGNSDSGLQGLWPGGIAAGGLWDGLTAPWSRFG